MSLGYMGAKPKSDQGPWEDTFQIEDAQSDLGWAKRRAAVVEISFGSRYDHSRTYMEPTMDT